MVRHHVKQLSKAAITILILGLLVNANVPGKADTHGNTDSYEGTDDSAQSTSPKSVTSLWWSGTTIAVTQRYGCTIEAIEPDAAPSYCPYPYNAGWHQGIDLGIGKETTIYARVAGTVAAAVTSCLDSGCSLGYLAIRTTDGHIVYLLHGSPNAGFTQAGARINIGDAVYTTGSNGYSTGAHLHFEVHTSVVGELSVSVGPGDDINPEAWLTLSTAQPVAASRVSGNFLGTGYDAAAVLYDYGAGHARILMWPNPNGSSLSTWTSSWWDSWSTSPASVPNPFDVKKAKLVAGYFEGGPYEDIAILYDTSNSSCTNHAVWYVLHSTGSGFHTYLWWDSQQSLSSMGCLFAVSRSKPIVGDFEGDGRSDDVAVLYDESSGGCANSVVWWVFLSTTVGTFALDTPTGDSAGINYWYSATCGAFSWSGSKAFSGYFGSAIEQPAVFYDYSVTCSVGQPRSRVYRFTIGTQKFYLDSTPIWDSGSACNRFPWAKSVPMAGNFTGHTSNQTDVSVLFDSSSACPPGQPRTQLYMLVWNGSALQDSSQSPWDSQCNQFSWNWSKPEVGYFTPGFISDIAVLYYYTWHCPTQEVDSGWLIFVPSGQQFTGWTRWDPQPPSNPPSDPCNGVDWNASTPT